MADQPEDSSPAPHSVDYDHNGEVTHPAPAPSRPHPARRQENLEPEEPEDDGGPIKPFLEHLEDLRWVLIKCVAALVLGMGTCMAAAPIISEILQYPKLVAGVFTELNSMGPLAPVVIIMKMGIYGGIAVSVPFFLFFIGQYVLPALKPNEKKYFIRAFIIGGGLFFFGVLLCYFFMLPLAISGIVAMNDWLKMSTDFWRGEEYFQFVILFMMGSGLSMELPVVLLTLVRMGILSHEALVKGRKYFFVGNFALCAFITPDFASTFLMVIPVQILLEICIQISKHWERQKRKLAAAGNAN